MLSVKAPPTKGPITEATANVPPRTPLYFPRSLGGTMSAIIIQTREMRPKAQLKQNLLRFDHIPPPPIPCIPLALASMAILVLAPPIADPIRKIVTANINIVIHIISLCGYIHWPSSKDIRKSSIGWCASSGTEKVRNDNPSDSITIRITEVFDNFRKRRCNNSVITATNKANITPANTNRISAGVRGATKK